MSRRRSPGRFRRAALATLALLALLAIAGWAALRVSPWPSVLAIRWAFDRGSAQASAALEKHVPAGIRARTGMTYDPADPDATLDLYLPPPATGPTAPLPVVVWIHGGGFVSGRKEDIGNYARILAGRGFAVASIDYTLAPTARWPGPTRQANAALRWLRVQAPALGIDPERVVLAGDSAGAQIAAELANAITSADHARRIGIEPALPPGALAGTLLYCGPYDVALVRGDGPAAGFLRTVLWSYFGRRDGGDATETDAFSVARHVTPAFPPTFISAGNADPLLPHSRALAEALRAQGVRVHALFFADDHVPALPHEYQFNLDTGAGQRALEESVAFLESLGDRPATDGASAPAMTPAPTPAPPGR
jgi:acetyl esterase/lipase